MVPKRRTIAELRSLGACLFPCWAFSRGIYFNRDFWLLSANRPEGTEPIHRVHSAAPFIRSLAGKIIKEGGQRGVVLSLFLYLRRGVPGEVRCGFDSSKNFIHPLRIHHLFSNTTFQLTSHTRRRDWDSTRPCDCNVRMAIAADEPEAADRRSYRQCSRNRRRVSLRLGHS